MMRCKYKALDGTQRVFDLDDAVDVVQGHSLHRPEWQALLMYSALSGLFIETRSSATDFKDGFEEEVEEVSESYVCEAFHLNLAQLDTLRDEPRKWKLINLR
jgi:hypothetical protein